MFSATSSIPAPSAGVSSRRLDAPPQRVTSWIPILEPLPEDLLRFVEDALSNDENASDDELAEHFAAEGLTPGQARQALTYRTRYLMYVYQTDASPIRKGRATLRFNPYTRRFEPEPD